MTTKTVSSSFGRNIKVTIRGGSHEPEISVRIEGLPEGFSASSIDGKELEEFMARRAPGNTPYGTARKETDLPILKSEDPLVFVIENHDQRSGDYDAFRRKPRPGHADYTARVKYGDSINMAGGGPFSGRMTAPLCVAGGIARQILADKGIAVSAKLIRAGGKTGDAMYDEIMAAKAEGDSVGGLVTCTITGVPAGIGGPMYDGLESYIAPIVFGIPGVKGLAFGDGFDMVDRRGSENNDPFITAAGPDGTTRVLTETNHAGGILGGISDGMDITLSVAFKPTPSIAKEQRTVDLETMEETTLKIGGRHDPCIAVRGVPVVEAAAALGLLDAMLEKA